MQFLQKLHAAQALTNSALCVGLDTDVERLPAPFTRTISSMAVFNRAIIEVTSDLACAYKLNWAFYEQYGTEGLQILEETLRHIPPHIVTIADAKRGDIGNTSAAYAKSTFEMFGCDAVTVAPYMGRDSVQPFLDYPGKMTFVLALTSNQGSADFQRLRIDGGEPLYQRVMRTAMTWTQHENIGFVVGATHPHELVELRGIFPSAPFLIPGVGTQGGDAAATMLANGSGPAIVNVSRAVLYASSGTDFAEAARKAALQLARALYVPRTA
jgi:orotidine-5'-phosphate decarboxylase